LGSVAFGILWFAVALIPAFAIASSAGVIGFTPATPWAWAVFTIVWSATFVAYLFETLFSFAIDPPTGSRTWFEGLVFPGLISLAIMLIAVSGLTLFSGAADWIEVGRWSWRDIPIQLILAWNAISTIAGRYRLDRAGASKWLRNSFWS
jgi:hypothetical protein